MRERPILFSGPMVRAIQEGRKTQTRRIIKPQPIEQHGWVGGAYWERRPERGIYPADRWCIRDILQFCPYGRPGDRLWLRETWLGYWGFELPGARRIIDAAVRQSDGTIAHASEADPMFVHYAADDPEPPIRRWTPSIHMPRWASRITLEITDVRVELLREISVEDCVAEGITTTLRGHDACVALRDDYRRLWDSLNAERGYGWDVNPFVWCISFNRLMS